MPLTLAVHHNIHLSREERYALHEGKPIVVVGVSIPVWFDKNISSEPAKEVFCKYYLYNSKHETPIRIMEDGYEITLPNKSTPLDPISNEVWRSLTPSQLDVYYRNQYSQASSENLLDQKDGGSEHLFYREHNKMKIKDEMLTVVHFIEIDPIERLIASIEF